MKFHRVKIENLNSLYGSQTVDFEGDVHGSSLFLIVGPTGAGKSTILDAICLALFGQTPRLERRTGKGETDIAHIMSLGMARAYAEVEFSTFEADGTRRRYIAGWSARRAYDDPEGSVQPPERSLHEVNKDGSLTLVVSDHRRKYYDRPFRSALHGLSVEDFQRSILLAQGEFSAFLSASPSEKASILERLTNTDNYREIGARASARRRAVEERHRGLLARLQEMQVLTSAEEDALAVEIQGAEINTRAAAEHLAATVRVVEWVQQRLTLAGKITTAEEALGRAEAALQERAEDRDRLSRHEKLAAVEPIWRESQRTRTELVDAEDKLKPVQAELEALAISRPSVIEAVGTAQRDLDAIIEKRAALEPSIRRAYELRTTRATLDAQISESHHALEQRRRAEAEGAAALKTANDALSAAQRNHDAATSRLNELANSRLLTERYPDLRATHDRRIGPLQERSQRLQNEVAELELRAREVRATRQEHQEGLDSAVASSQAALEACERDRVVLADRLDDTALSQSLQKLTEVAERFGAQSSALREAGYIGERIAEHESERAEVIERLDRSAAEIAKLQRESEDIDALEGASRARVGDLERSLRQAEQLILLSTHRQELVDGEPCPLCGSPLHPYTASVELAAVDAEATRDRDAILADLETARSDSEAVSTRAKRVVNRLVAQKMAHSKDEAQLVVVKSELESEQSKFVRATKAAGFEGPQGLKLRDPALLRAALEEARLGEANARASLEGIEAARAAVESSERALNQAEKVVKRIRKDTDKLDSEIAKREDALSRRQRDWDVVIEELRTANEDLRDRLRESGVNAVADEPLSETMDRARQRRDELAAADQAEATAREAVGAAQMQARELDSAHRAQSQALRERTDAHDSLLRRRQELDANIGETLEGRDPDDVRREMTKMQDDAKVAVEAAEKALATHAESEAVANARLQELSARRLRADGENEHAQARLSALLNEHGLTTREVAEDLLDPQAHKTLASQIRELEKGKTRAADRLADAKDALAHHELLPIAQDEAETGLQDAQARRDESQSALNQATLELGALRERWRKHEQTKSRRGEVEGELLEVQGELDVWTTIYDLIGVSEGERFKLFAQSLNLQSLVDNANVRLEKLYPRYELAVARGEAGEPTLSFSVRDHYQASAERPLTTLSGGESFLVSLALALGLADFRRIDMPIETLLLDEGFGSLDQDSLHVALTTLRQLHQDGSRQVGIISHVDMLRELIDARIVVEPRGHGRSRIRFEFGYSAESEDARL